MRSGTASVLVVLCASTATAFSDDGASLEHRWPSVPDGHGLSLENQITDHLTELGNTLGHHLDLLSHDMFVLQVDGRRRRAHVRLGGGDSERLAVRVDG